MAFDQYKALLKDADGRISGPRTVIAGFGAGVTESLLAVTPFESIKTTLYTTRSPSPYLKSKLTGLKESMTESLRTLVCADSCMLFPL